MEYPSLAPRGNTGGFFYSTLSRVRHGIAGFFIKFMGVVIKYYRKWDCGYETVFMGIVAEGSLKGSWGYGGV
jgi:hypothetical protein